MEIKEATLFYRTIGSDAYSSINMEQLSKGTFSVSIPKDDIAEPGIEYYSKKIKLKVRVFRV